MKLNARARAYIGLVICLALGSVAGLAALSRTSVQPVHAYYATALGGMILVARRFPLELSPKKKVILDTSAVMAAVLLLPPVLAVVACTAGNAIGQTQVRAPSFQKVFNVSVMAIQSTLAALAYAWLPSAVSLPRESASLLPAVTAGVCFYGSNVLLIDGIVSLQMQRRFLYNWWGANRENCQYQVTLLLFGALAAVLASVHPLLLLVLVLPTGVVYHSLKHVMQLLRFQTVETVKALADIVDMRDHYTFEHSQRVANIARDVARTMRLSEEEVQTIYLAARVHDVGKIGITDPVLLKEDHLEEGEWEQIRKHPEIGAKLVESLPEFRHGRELILSHHERFDGTGYPRGISGDRIPLGARIIAVVDAYDTMTSHRPYRGPLERTEVVAELKRNSGTQFDPAVVGAFFAWLTQEEAPTAAVAPPSAITEHERVQPVLAMRLAS